MRQPFLPRGSHVTCSNQLTSTPCQTVINNFIYFPVITRAFVYMYIFRSVHSLWHSGFDALRCLLCGMPKPINGNDGWRARGQHRNTPTQADGECWLRSCCLKQSLPVYESEKKDNTIIACFTYLSLWTIWVTKTEN